jgi:RNA polymerase sigma factor (sigma-70 family)
MEDAKMARFSDTKHRRDAETLRRWQMFTAHRAIVERYIKRLVPDSSDAADVLQQVSLLVLSNSAADVDPQHFDVWCKDLVDEVLSRRAESASHEILAPFGAKILDISSETEEELLSREALIHMLEGVKEDAQQMLQLRYIDGHTASEIASQLKQSPASIRMRLSRLRGALRKRYSAREASALRSLSR